MDRIHYSIAKDSRYIEQMVDRTVRGSAQWQAFCRILKEKTEHSEMYIFGAGIWGNILYYETNRFVQWDAVIDSCPEGKNVGKIPVISLDKLSDCMDRDITVVISSYKNGSEMLALLQEAGVSQDKIVDAGDVIYQLTEGAIYFDLEQMNPQVTCEFFVDAGCFDGFTTKEFFRWCKNKGYAYCFEPDSKNVGTVLRTLSNEAGRYELIKKALWSKTTTLSMDARGDFATSVTLPNEGDYLPRVEAVALDDLLGDQEVTFIKMDIEGAETEALRGAQKIITEQKPKLAISIYHKPEDILTIPRLILEYNSSYKFYLRHYSFSDYDTVLYAIP
ncbi:MAG: FkbM family methyltransferase [Lachnospiraceae bacterium]|nr:FkbM family methyltransferase [Lachnospiraceae bacterium]